MHKMHFGPPSCKFYENEIETTLHVLRDCPLAKVVWSNILNVQLRDRFFVEDLESWIGLNLDGSMRWSSMWATACYFLWFWRNKEVHEASFTRPRFPWQIITKSVDDYMNATMQKKNPVMQTRCV